MTNSARNCSKLECDVTSLLRIIEELEKGLLGYAHSLLGASNDREKLARALEALKELATRKEIVVDADSKRIILGIREKIPMMKLCLPPALANAIDESYAEIPVLEIIDFSEGVPVLAVATLPSDERGIELLSAMKGALEGNKEDADRVAEIAKKIVREGVTVPSPIFWDLCRPLLLAMPKRYAELLRKGIHARRIANGDLAAIALVSGCRTGIYHSYGGVAVFDAEKGDAPYWIWSEIGWNNTVELAKALDRSLEALERIAERISGDQEWIPVLRPALMRGYDVLLSLAFPRIMDWYADEEFLKSLELTSRILEEAAKQGFPHEATVARIEGVPVVLAAHPTSDGEIAILAISPMGSCLHKAGGPYIVGEIALEAAKSSDHSSTLLEAEIYDDLAEVLGHLLVKILARYDELPRELRDSVDRLLEEVMEKAVS